MSLQQLSATSFEENIYDNGEACLVVFSKKGCHVCQEVIPVLEDLHLKYLGKFAFYNVDVEKNKSLFQRFSLKGVPQILFFNGGDFQGKLAGKVDDEQIEEKIKEIIGSL